MGMSKGYLKFQVAFFAAQSAPLTYTGLGIVD